MPEYTSLPTTSDASDKLLPPAPSTSRGRHDGGRPGARRRLALLGLGSLLGLASVATLSRNVDVTHRVRGMVVDRVGYDARGRPVVDFEAEELPDQFKCNPFKERGRLAVDTVNPVSGLLFSWETVGIRADRLMLNGQSETVWRPYDETCPPSRLMRHLMSSPKNAAPAASSPHRMARAVRRHPKSANANALRNLPDDLVDDEGDDTAEAGAFLPWLVNATILLQGESPAVQT